MTGTRPDIANAVGVFSRKLDNTCERDWIRLKPIFLYLKGAVDKSLIYNFEFQKGILESCSDVDHGGDALTGCSTTGVMYMV